MKKRNFISLALLSLVTTLFTFSLTKNENAIVTEAYYTKTGTLPTTIDLNSVDDATIRNYYADLNNLTDDEKQGQNLLKNLKPILKNNQKYYEYDTTDTFWKLYEITDRDWVKSPASAIPGYDPDTNIITGYSYGTNASTTYLHALYDSRDLPNGTVASDHTTSPNGINREHVWPKSHGFSEYTDHAGAPGDPINLLAGNALINQQQHNNNFYGFVDFNASPAPTTQPYDHLSNNYEGVSRTLGGTDLVFEPQDSDKGDIARIVFYMAARYNFIGGVDADPIDSSNPNLELVQSEESPFAGYESSETVTGKLGVLSDLIAWHTIDPVDEYEIRRNDILFRNYSLNRNPFVDFPSWVYYIWGTANNDGTGHNATPTGVANPLTDTVHDFNDNSIKPTSFTLNTNDLTIQLNQTFKANVETVEPENAVAQVNWSVISGTDVVSVSDTGLITGIGVGNAVVRASAAHDNNVYQDINVTVTEIMHVPASSITLSKTTTSLTPGKTEKLTATVLPTNASSKEVEWSTSHSGIVTVNDGLITGVASGTATVTATAVDGGVSATCVVNVISEPVTITSDAYREALFAPINIEKYVGGYINDGFYAENPNPAYDIPFRVNTKNVYDYKDWDYVKIGHKTSSFIATITTDQPMKVPLERIELDSELDYLNGFKGATLYTSPIDDFSKDVNSYPIDIPTVTGKKIITITISNPAPNLYYKLEFDTVGNTKGNGTLILYNIKFFEYITATKYAEYFLQNTICDATGNTVPTYENSNTWLTLKSYFTNLDVAEQTTLRNVIPNAEGDPLERAIARYDFIILKYGTANYEDFMGRNPQPLGYPELINNRTTLDYIFLVLVSAFLIPTFYFGKHIYKKKN